MSCYLLKGAEITIIKKKYLVYIKISLNNNLSINIKELIAKSLMRYKQLITDNAWKITFSEY